ncbi:hypothetical protein Pst134EA_027806 [Puccinia striiformis f. sp. tritici]|uniref:hypothetical protein n=1 Tax=Puccinia striiformis f. sp. tritici TaxID=168172 RepID=UPI0020086668|nr:hypothetical protein Pst134EA_027806 [Puccinia striiformis f. sp. tritici]KAH9442106.1 hypothetical protein Pst134EB_028375 [Puccinia striiformis f. sp. tritici]KAH9448495.1 hypothetical protein Pst134EA_027806 [Puccinia striiformis f. sp. tritici]KAI9608087.1 hypothetical protein H4Q26_005542 [Puccinia striiformis f. sp. tritici PST-130]
MSGRQRTKNIGEDEKDAGGGGFAYCTTGVDHGFGIHGERSKVPRDYAAKGPAQALQILLTNHAQEFRLDQLYIKHVFGTSYQLASPRHGQVNSTSRQITSEAQEQRANFEVFA